MPVDFYRWDNIATNTLLYPKLLHSPPRHSHSIVPDLGNALIKQRKAQCRTGSTVFDPHSALAIAGEHQRAQAQRDMASLQILEHLRQHLVGCLAEELRGGLEYLDLRGRSAPLGSRLEEIHEIRCAVRLYRGANDRIHPSQPLRDVLSHAAD
jgi:hypothetical protein